MMKVFAQGYEIGVNHCVPRPTSSNPGYSSRLATCSPCRGGRRSVDPHRGTNCGQNHGVFRQSHFQRYWVFDPRIEVRKLRRGGGNDKGATFERLAPLSVIGGKSEQTISVPSPVRVGGREAPASAGSEVRNRSQAHALARRPRTGDALQGRSCRVGFSCRRSAIQEKATLSIQTSMAP